MIALAAQRYGLVVRDQTHHGISLFGEVPAQAAGQRVRSVLQGQDARRSCWPSFPWDRLQVLPMHLCTVAPCHER